MRPFIERCPHSTSVGVAGVTGLPAWVCECRTAGLDGLEFAVDLADISLYRASRIARIAASLLIVHSPDEL